MMGNRSWDEWISEYSASHQHPKNQLCHLVGIPLVASGSALLVASIVFPFLWKFALTVFAVGWFFQFLGHYFEKKPPEFLRDPRFLLVGARWWWAKHITHKA